MHPMGRVGRPEESESGAGTIDPRTRSGVVGDEPAAAWDGRLPNTISLLARRS